MAYPFNRPSGRQPAAKPRPPIRPNEWRCFECGKLLGVRHGAQVHIRLQRHSYLVSLPVAAVCPGCDAKNET